VIGRPKGGRKEYAYCTREKLAAKEVRPMQKRTLKLPTEPLSPEQLEELIQKLLEGDKSKKLGRIFVPEDFEDIVLEEDEPSKQ